MNEKTNEENTIYLVSMRLTEMVFITKAKSEKEAKNFVARYLITNKSTYKNLTNIVERPDYLNHFVAIKLSSVTKVTEITEEGHVSNVARMISDLDFNVF